jgi:hypothetical protein
VSAASVAATWAVTPVAAGSNETAQLAGDDAPVKEQLRDVVEAFVALPFRPATPPATYRVPKSFVSPVDQDGVVAEPAASIALLTTTPPATTLMLKDADERLKLKLLAT